MQVAGEAIHAWYVPSLASVGERVGEAVVGEAVVGEAVGETVVGEAVVGEAVGQSLPRLVPAMPSP